MKTQARPNYSTILTAAVASALLVTATTAQALSEVAGTTAKEVLQNRGPAANAALPEHAKANSGVFGELGLMSMDSPRLSLTLADGQVLEANLQRSVVNKGRGRQSWVGAFVDDPQGVLVITKFKGVTTGFANYRGKALEILPSDRPGRHVLFEVDNERLPKGEVVRKPAIPADSATGVSDYGLGGSTLAVGDSVVQDVLVVYSAASAARYGQPALESMIQSAVESANQAYQNSNVGITLNPVGIQQTSLAEAGNMDATVTALQTDENVAQLRDQLGADMVIMVSENSDYCGLSNLMSSNSSSFAPYAYGVVYSACLSNQSLAHELGHQQGLMHDRASSPYGGVYPYSYGYRVCLSDGTGFRDIMSYSCSGAPRVLLFSNPDVTYNGHPAGISYETSPSTSAENARSMNNTAATVAAFRSTSSGTQPPSSSVPATPSSLGVRSVAYNEIALAWLDNASNETGFKVQRSSDGVIFSEIATLGADAASFVDRAVSARTTYYYRVSAFNSAGISEFSNGVSATTPDAPPPPPVAPTGVLAANNADGSATISWSVASSTAASFEIMRESYDSRRNRWRGGSVVATVPSGVRSLVDVSGNGVFRYYVRSVNLAGSSAYAGPSEVLVSGGADTGSTGTSGKGKGKGRKGS